MDFLHVGGVNGVHVIQLLANPADVRVRCIHGPLDQSLLSYGAAGFRVQDPLLEIWFRVSRFGIRVQDPSLGIWFRV